MRGKHGTAGQRAHALPMQEAGQDNENLAALRREAEWLIVANDAAIDGASERLTA